MKAQFSLASFDWFSNSEAKIYLHCTVKICDENLEQNGLCTPSCPTDSRRRRWAGQFEEPEIGGSGGEVMRVDLGPIYLGYHNTKAGFTQLPKY